MGSGDDWEGLRGARGCPAGARYAIRVQGHLDADWSEWLDGMTITHEEGGVTRLEGVLRDQAALHGVLNKLRDLSLTVVALQRLDGDPPSEQPSGYTT